MEESNTIVSACAWCEELKPKEERVKGNVSHGICETHYQKMKSLVQFKKASQELECSK